MGYCRIRYTSGGDYKRTERHREVLTKIFEKILSMSPTSYPSLLNDLLPMVSTSLDAGEIMDLGNKVLSIGNTSLEQERFPRDGYCEGQMINGVYYLVFDKEVTVWGRADLKDVDDSNLGLKGSPTKIAKASDKVRKGAGEKVALDTDEAVSYLIGKFKEKHII